MIFLSFFLSILFFSLLSFLFFSFFSSLSESDLGHASIHCFFSPRIRAKQESHDSALSAYECTRVWSSADKELGTIPRRVTSSGAGTGTVRR